MKRLGMISILMQAEGVANSAGGGNGVVVNPLSAPITAQIQTQLVTPKEVSFHFRKDKEVEEKNASAKGKTKRPTFKMQIPLLTSAGLIAALTAGDKSGELALDQANEAIINRARGLIGEKVDGDTFNVETGKWNLPLTADMFNVEDLSFLKIAMLPKSERGSGISKEAWAAFVTDYIDIMKTKEAIELMPDKQARSDEILAKHGIILGGKFNAVRSRKDIIGQMKGFLDVWAQVSPNLDEHMECYEHLKSKADVLLQADDFNNL